MTIDTAAIESLRSFAIANDEMQFAHMCTAALAGEEWAVEQLGDVVLMVSGPMPRHLDDVLSAIRATDCTRPDGAIARRIEI